MVDYREMYLKMVRAAAQAADILIRAQQECEEMYINAEDTPVLYLYPEKE